MNLLFLHGAGGSSKVWTFQKRVFGGQHMELHEGGGKRTIEEYAEFVREYVERKNLGRIVLVGHSMGGAIALMYALKYETERLVLVGTGARLRVAPEILDSLAKDYPSACRMILGYAFAQNPPESLFRMAFADMESVPPSVTLADFEACNAYDVTARLGEIRVPTLILCGMLDRMTPPKYSQFLSERIANSRLHLIEGAGHMVMLEKPDEVNNIMKDFLEMR
jgi:pimeloyl-ACP methyl ester carboxylesterase